MPLPLYLNELSLSIQNFTQAKKLEMVLGFIDTLRTAKKKRPDIELHSSSSLYECEIGNGDYFCTILKSHHYDDHWRFIKILVQRTPLDMNNMTVNVLLNAQQATGVALALKNRSAAVSLRSHQAWENCAISVTVEDVEKLVHNLAIPEHVNALDELFCNYGINVSASSVVFQDGAIQVRMFLDDHNPPHIHVDFPDYTARINLRTFDIMDGRLPQHVSSSIISWARQNQQELLANWERCRAGNHPFLIGN